MKTSGSAFYIGQYEDFFYHIATENGVVDLNDSAKIIYVNDRMEQIRLLAHSNFYTIGIPKYPDEGLHYKVANIPLRASNEHLRFGIITKENKRPTDIEAEFIEEVTTRYHALSDAAEADAT